MNKKDRSELLKELKIKVQSILIEKKNKNKHKIFPEPRYDDVWEEGVKWLNSL